MTGVAFVTSISPELHSQALTLKPRGERTASVVISRLDASLAAGQPSMLLSGSTLEPWRYAARKVWCDAANDSVMSPRSLRARCPFGEARFFAGRAGRPTAPA